MDKLVHWDIPSTDPSKSADFYAALFGWKMQRWDPTYILFEVEGGVGGGINKVDKMPEPAIEPYIGVADIPATLKKAEALGGSVVRQKREIGQGMGFLAEFKDSCGCLMGLWSQN